jgi:hypothetical protein
VKRFVQSVALILFFFCAVSAQAQQRQMLHDGWMIQSSATAGVDGAAISSSSYNPAGWHRATVP